MCIFIAVVLIHDFSDFCWVGKVWYFGQVWHFDVDSLDGAHVSAAAYEINALYCTCFESFFVQMSGSKGSLQEQLVADA